MANPGPLQAINVQLQASSVHPQARPPSSTMTMHSQLQQPMTVANLPVELQARLLQTLVNTGASSLPPFLNAFPQLAALVLLISDHVESSEQLVEIPGCKAVDPGDHVLISQLRRSRPITVFSYIKCDEEAAFGRLTRSSDCPYGRSMDSQSAAFARLYGKSLFGLQFIKHLTQIKGCSSPNQLVIIHHRSRVKGSHVELAGGGSRTPPKLTVTSSTFLWNTRSMTTSDDPEIPTFAQLPFAGENLWILRWQCVTELSINCCWVFSNQQRLPHLKRIRFSCPLANKCFDSYTLTGGTYGTKCAHSIYGWDLAYKVEEVYIEFSASRTPIISSGPWTCCSINKAVQFSFLNLDWSERGPTVSSSLCSHARQYRCDYVEWSRHERQRPLTFLKIFENVTFIGIPDKIVAISTLSMAKKLVWKRLMPDTPIVTIKPPVIINCPVLETVVLATRLCQYDRTALMPVIDSPSLHTLDLCAVHGSDKVWSLLFHFTEKTLASVKELSMTAKHTKTSNAPHLTLWDLKPVSSSIQSLSVTGYIPSFIAPSLYDDHDMSFPNLTALRLDVSYLRMEILPGPQLPLLSLLFDMDTFPALESLTLELSRTQSSPFLYDGMCIKIQVPISCQLLTVSESLAYNRFVLIIEEEGRCRSRVLDRGHSFFNRMGELGYMSVLLSD